MSDSLQEPQTSLLSNDLYIPGKWPQPWLLHASNGSFDTGEDSVPKGKDHSAYQHLLSIGSWKITSLQPWKI